MRKTILYSTFAVVSILINSISTSNAQTVSRTMGYFKESTFLQNFVHNNQVILSSSEKDKQVRMIASDLSMKKNWEQTLAGSLIYSGGLKDHILVVVSTEFKDALGGDNSTYRAYILDPSNGKVVAEKIIYNGNNDYVTYPTVTISKDGKTFNLFAKETGLKRSIKIVPGGLVGGLIAGKKCSDDLNKVRSFSVSDYNSKLELVDKVIPFLPAGDFIGAAKTINNDLYIAVSEERKGVTIAKYEAGKDKASSTVFEPINHSAGFLGDNKINDRLTLLTDTLNDNTVYLTGSFTSDDEFKCIFNKYDFGSKNHKKFSKSFKKAEFKALEKSYKPINKDLKSLELGSTRNVEVQQVFCTEDNYMLAIGDIHWVPAAPGSRLPSTYTANGIMIYTLDTDLKEKAVSSIPREYDHLVKPDLAAYYRDNSWNLFASDRYKGRFLISKVNSTTGAIEDIKLVEPEKADKSDRPNLDQMVITDKQIIVPLLDYKLSFSTKLKNDVNIYQMRW